jgi:hypothetical protein
VGLKRFRQRTLEAVVRQYLPVEEDEETTALLARCRAARRRGYLTQGLFVKACRWKSPRAIKHVRANTHHRVRAATTAALAARGDASRLQPLLDLKGVSVPTASAVLALLDPRRYGVIDIRVWQVLRAFGAVRENRTGTSLSVAQWLQFLSVLRPMASRLGVTVREVELSLFNAHRARQVGRLYGGRDG